MKIIKAHDSFSLLHLRKAIKQQQKQIYPVHMQCTPKLSNQQFDSWELHQKTRPKYRQVNDEY